MTLEIRIVDRIRDQLRAAGCESLKTNLHGEPDILACCPFGSYGEGLFVAIEVKVPGEEPPPIQIAKLERWKRSGAIAFWTDSSESIVDRIMNGLQQRNITNFLPLNL